MTTPTVADALTLQATACGTLGSPLYERLLHDLRADFDRGGLTFEVLEGASTRPVHDAIPLRLLGAVHRIVLRGEAAALATHYPSVGGSGAPVPIEDFLAVVAAHRAEIAEALGRQVQTNEVGRAAALIVGFAELSRRWGLPLRTREVGASAGLNLRWDHFAYDTGAAVAGDPSSPLVFRGVWTHPPDLSGLTLVANRRGCDVAPIDVADPDQRLRLLSFVWPDQTERFARLRAAIRVAEQVPATVDAADAGEWLAHELAAPVEGTTTVVYHSIVWQYLSQPTREAMRTALRHAGTRATPSAPLAWLRLEPAGNHAELRVTTWPAGDETLLATSGYHGADVTPR